MQEYLTKTLEEFERSYLPRKTEESRSIGVMSIEDGQRVKSFLTAAIKGAYERGREEEHKFFHNILDGVDIADEQMGNKGGGTKAIRFALQSRFTNPTKETNASEN